MSNADETDVTDGRGFLVAQSCTEFDTELHNVIFWNTDWNNLRNLCGEIETRTNERLFLIKAFCG